jgi:hypothetical protein
MYAHVLNLNILQSRKGRLVFIQTFAIIDFGGRKKTKKIGHPFG